MITKKNKGYMFLVGILILFSLNFVSASVNNWRCEDNGISIGYKDQPVIKQGEDYFFSVHTYNSSTGTPLNIGNSYCALHLYNSSGSHIVINNNISFGLTSYDFFLNIEGENFSENGNYPFVVACIGNNNIESGVCSSSLEVTLNGEDFTTAKSISYLGFILICVLLLLTTIYGGVKVKWKHPKNKENEIIGINNFRYIKVFLFAMAYFEAMFLFGLSYKFFNEGGLEGFTEFFNFIYQMFLNLMYPIIVVMIVMIFAIWINNKNLSKNIKLGLS
jgi:hypothetical protein